jgi:hypothetical protein
LGGELLESERHVQHNCQAFEQADSRETVALWHYTSIAVRNDVGKIVMECVIETKANVILDFIHGLRGELQATFEEGTWATWLYDLLKPHVAKLVVCDPRKNSRQGNKNDRIDARELSDRLYMNKLSSVYHGGAGVRILRELARS